MKILYQIRMSQHNLHGFPGLPPVRFIPQGTNSIRIISLDACLTINQHNQYTANNSHIKSHPTRVDGTIHSRREYNICLEPRLFTFATLRVQTVVPSINGGQS